VVLSLSSARTLFVVRRAFARVHYEELAADLGYDIEHTATETRISYPDHVAVYTYYRPDYDKSVTIVG
jgi:hypothetical protein